MSVVFNFENVVLENTYYKHVIHTDDYQQIVLMSIVPGKQTGPFVHAGTSQYIHIVEGFGVIELNEVITDVATGDAIVIPPDTEYVITNTGDETMKLYIVYAGDILHAHGDVEV